MCAASRNTLLPSSAHCRWGPRGLCSCMLWRHWDADLRFSVSGGDDGASRDGREGGREKKKKTSVVDESLRYSLLPPSKQPPFSLHIWPCGDFTRRYGNAAPSEVHFPYTQVHNAFTLSWVLAFIYYCGCYLTPAQEVLLWLVWLLDNSNTVCLWVWYQKGMERNQTQRIQQEKG